MNNTAGRQTDCRDSSLGCLQFLTDSDYVITPLIHTPALDIRDHILALNQHHHGSRNHTYQVRCAGVL